MKQVIAHHRTQYDIIVKVIVSDNEAIITSRAFRTWCADNGIKLRLCTAYVHNDGLSRLNVTIRTLMEKTRALTMYDGVPRAAWLFALKHCAMIYNCLPPARGDDITSPYQKVTGGKRPNLARLLHFGAIVMFTNPVGAPGTKLDARATVGVYLGVTDYSCVKAFLLVPERDGTARRNIVTTSQFVVLDERLDSIPAFTSDVVQGKTATSTVGYEKRILAEREQEPAQLEKQRQATTRAAEKAEAILEADLHRHAAGGAATDTSTILEDTKLGGGEEALKLRFPLAQFGDSPGAHVDDEATWETSTPEDRLKAIFDKRRDLILTKEQRDEEWPRDKYVKLPPTAAYHKMKHKAETQVKSGRPYLLELFSGTGIVSQVARDMGFFTVTVDVDANFGADICEDVHLINERRLGAPHLVVIGLPCSTSYTRLSMRVPAGTTPPRDKDTGQALTEKALADDELRKRVFQILKHLKKNNPSMLIVFENPSGMLAKQPEMHRLLRTTTSFCSYDEAGPMKDTDLFTNWPIELKPKCPRTGPHRQHEGQVLDLPVRDRGKWPEGLAMDVLRQALAEIQERERTVDATTLKKDVRTKFAEDTTSRVEGSKVDTQGKLEAPLPGLEDEVQEELRQGKREAFANMHPDNLAKARKERKAKRAARTATEASGADATTTSSETPAVRRSERLQKAITNMVEALAEVELPDIAPEVPVVSIIGAVCKEIRQSGAALAYDIDDPWADYSMDNLIWRGVYDRDGTLLREEKNVGFINLLAEDQAQLEVSSLRDRGNKKNVPDGAPKSFKEAVRRHRDKIEAWMDAMIV